MKQSLVEKNLHRGRLVEELVASEVYKLIHERLVLKKEQATTEALGSKTIEDLRYNRGLIDGLDFFEDIVSQWRKRAETQRKRIKK
jgi:predicted nucleic acid-binding protein